MWRGAALPRVGAARERRFQRWRGGEPDVIGLGRIEQDRFGQEICPGVGDLLAEQATGRLIRRWSAILGANLKVRVAGYQDWSDAMRVMEMPLNDETLPQKSEQNGGKEDRVPDTFVGAERAHAISRRRSISGVNARRASW